jgi:hypothetical protein
MLNMVELGRGAGQAGTVSVDRGEFLGVIASQHVQMHNPRMTSFTHLPIYP